MKWRLIKLFFLICALSSALITISIFVTMLIHAIPFFREVSIWEFLTGTEWTPLFTSKRFGVLPLVWGTYMTSLLAMGIVIPAGTMVAIYLAEFAKGLLRELVAIIIEVLAMIPSVVYGYFALIFITPFLKEVFPSIQTFNALSASIAMGIMILPLMVSLTYDLLRQVPMELRYAAYALGATRLFTVFYVLIPAALRGYISIILLCVTRAIGETMVVTIAAGQLPQITLSPLQSVQTMCSYIANTVSGDISPESIEFHSVHAVAVLLIFNVLIFTIAQNVIMSGRK